MVSEINGLTSSVMAISYAPKKQIKMKVVQGGVVVSIIYKLLSTDY